MNAELRRWAPLGLAMAALLALFRLWVGPHFLSADNLANIPEQVAETGIVACGMTLVILTGGIDLSVGATLAVSGSVAVWTLSRTGQPALAMAAAVAAGAAIGALNGWLVAGAGLPAFLATLASQQVARGLARGMNGGRPLAVPAGQEFFSALGTGRWLEVPIPAWLLLTAFAVLAVALHRTRFGQHLYAIGGNREAARYAGVPVAAREFRAYVICGMLAGAAGLISAAKLGSLQPTAGEGLELDAIAAAAVGGASLAGGVGAMPGTLLGALLIGTLNKGLNMAGVHFSLQPIAKGLAIFAAVWLDVRRRRRSGS